MTALALSTDAHQDMAGSMTGDPTETALFAARRETPGQQQGDPAAHGAADENLRPLRGCQKDAFGLREPVADATLGEVAPGRAMARIVETQESPSPLAGPVVEIARFGGRHVGGESAEPDEARPAVAARSGPAQASGDAPGRAAGGIFHVEKIGIVRLIVHEGWGLREKCRSRLNF